MAYIESGIMLFSRKYSNVEIHIFERDNCKITKYNVSPDNYHYYKKSEYKEYDNFEQVCLEINPNVLIVSGRVCGHYLRIAKTFKSKIFTVSIQDTQYEWSLKQLIIKVFSKFLYHKYFDAMWVCGSGGVSFSNSIGYCNENIFRNAYSANTSIFKPVDNKFDNKTILYVGRLVEVKNVKKLMNCFIKVNKQLNNGWKLIVVGDGPLKVIIPNKKDIIHITYKTQQELLELASCSDIFCLPSVVEPWGVVVHEFASLGMPLLLSKTIGSVSEFLIDGFNGFSFDPNSEDEILDSMRTMLTMNGEELKKFSLNSVHLSKRINSDIWASTLFSILLKGLKK